MVREKLVELRNTTGLNIKEFAKLIGLKYTTYYNYESGNREPDSDFLIFISKKFNVSVDWLLGLQDDKELLHSVNLNTGEMKIIEKYRRLEDFSKELINIIIDKELERSDLLKEKSAACKTRPIIHIENLVSAGTGKFIIDDMPPKLIEIPDTPDYKNASYAITVSGDSMEPDYYDGDIVLVEKRSNVDYGDIGIFVVDSEGFIKKCSPDGLVSLNSKYDIIKPIDKVYCMGKVIGKL